MEHRLTKYINKFTELQCISNEETNKYILTILENINNSIKNNKQIEVYCDYYSKLYEKLLDVCLQEAS